MYIKRINKKNMYMKSSKPLLTTFIIIYIYFSYRIRRVTLSTLNILNILTDLKAEIAELEFPYPNTKASTKLKITIIVSKTFILSLKYSDIPIPIIFRPISTVKM